MPVTWNKTVLPKNLLGLTIARVHCGVGERRREIDAIVLSDGTWIMPSRECMYARKAPRAKTAVKEE